MHWYIRKHHVRLIELIECSRHFGMLPHMKSESTETRDGSESIRADSFLFHKFD